MIGTETFVMFQSVHVLVIGFTFQKRLLKSQKYEIFLLKFKVLFLFIVRRRLIIDCKNRLDFHFLFCTTGQKHRKQKSAVIILKNKRTIITFVLWKGRNYSRTTQKNRRFWFDSKFVKKFFCRKKKKRKLNSTCF